MSSNNFIFQLGDLQKFLDVIFDELKKSCIDVSIYELDHICYRVSTNKKYYELKEKLKKDGKLIAENIVSGRKIATFKLYSPIIYKNRQINVIEIPSPKKLSNYIDGFEHVEFVIDKDFNTFINMYPNLDFYTKSIEKKINPEIKIGFNNFSVKFHHYSLEYVIKNFE